MADQETVEGWKRELAQAGVDGLAGGLRQHLPVAVGLLVIGLVVCGLIALLHLLLGDDWTIPTVLGLVLGAAGVGTPMAWVFFRKRREEGTPEGRGSGSREWAVLGSNQ